MRLIFSAWRGSPAGSIPASHAYIAIASGLPDDLVCDHYVLLTEGFELREDGRLHHIALAKLCVKMTEQFGREIESFAVAAAMAAQDPESFGIMSVEAVSKRIPRGKTNITRGFGFDMHPELRTWCEGSGYVGEEAQDWIMSRFIDFSTGRGDKQKDWPATFRTYAANEISRYNRLPPRTPPLAAGSTGSLFAVPRPSAPSGRAVYPSSASKGDRAIAHNMALLQDDSRPKSRTAG